MFLTWSSGLSTKCMPAQRQQTAIPWTVACQALLSMEFSRQDYRSGLPFPSAGDLPHPGIKPQVSCIGRQILYHCATQRT